MSVDNSIIVPLVFDILSLPCARFVFSINCNPLDDLISPLMLPRKDTRKACLREDPRASFLIKAMKLRRVDNTVTQLHRYRAFCSHQSNLTKLKFSPRWSRVEINSRALFFEKNSFRVLSSARETSRASTKKSGTKSLFSLSYRASYP